ncbi:hypothetical protein FJK98_02560 [Micromonospora sp. HM134]|uniref:hypothetical protein n=1 Tax=Micromonospora sp. HM134 TaxID=2583243 RepID=UPI0011988DD8|nr:hypothetical protein [Micromonospora sp. HM134]QDY06182.1 hypothetical protein FJK98_02560 [Micromonospora sp. HM134]
MATVAGTLAAVLFAVDHLARIEVAMGTYPLLGSLVCVGGCGWLVRSGDSRRRRDLNDGLVELLGMQAQAREQLRAELAQLTMQIEALRRQMRQPMGRAAGVCSPVGHMYVSGAAAAATDNSPDTVTRLPDPESLGAARRLARALFEAERRRGEDNPEDTQNMRR